MTDRQPAALPAAIPALIFALAIGASTHVPYSRATSLALLLVAALILSLGRKLTLRIAVGVLAAAAGLFSGSVEKERARHAWAVASALPQARFATVRAIPLRSWENGPDGERRLRVRGFDLVSPRHARIEQPLLIMLTGDAPELNRSGEISAEGFLSHYEGRWFLRVKSPELLAYEGAISRWDPRFWNRRLSEHLDRVTTEKIEEPVALARALVLGQSDRLPLAMRDSYRDGGTYHLLVFSGLQIGLGAAALAWLLRRFRRPVLSDASLLLIATLAPMFAGNEPSVARSSLMIGVWGAARLWARPTARANLLFVAAGVRLALHPEELYDPGFALTFAATAGLAITGPALARVLRLHQPLLRSACSGFCAELYVLPLTIFFFGRFVIGGWVVTMLVSPLIILLLATSALLCVASLVDASLVDLLARVISWLDAICRGSNAIVDDDLRLGGVALPAPLLLLITAYAAAVVASASRRPLIRVLAALAVAVPTIQPILQTRVRTMPAEPSVTMLDVGQGDAFVVSDGTSAILIDGGGGRRDPRFGERVLIPALLESGVRALDAVVMSHPHPDHCGGLAAVVLRLRVNEVWISGRHLTEPCSQNIMEAARRRRVPVVVLEKNDRVAAGSILVQPILPRLRYKKSALNNGSVVLHVRAGDLTFLATGDIEQDAEFVLTDDGVIPGAAVLKVPHHGSRTSSGEALLAAVAPRIALISCGKDNSYGHPAPDVLARLRRSGSRILRTDIAGAATVRLLDGDLVVDQRFD